RLYRLDRIPRQVFDLIHSTGYSFFFESLYILQINNFHIIEFPIVLSARTYGHSKMRIEDVFLSVQRLAELYTKAVVMNKRHLLMFQSSGAREQTALFSIREWDEYWKKKSSATGSLYDAFSAFYRKVIIRRQLNYFIKKHFTLGGSLLHAGCGSGQVDTDINRKYSITALDVSPHALELYRKFNRDNPRVVRGDIFCLSFKDDTFDGAYNLGVLEHFTEEDIMRILAELRRVIKPGGKILVFWPPEFGLSVRVLKMIRVVSRAILRREIKLHPDEVTLAKSRAHIETIGVKANLKVVDYYFGLRDCFTQIAVVFSKSIDTHSGQEHRQ
ncbi:MAG: methyltransferase domain-containing protein, partial [Candidatus Omnitrophica bacterium]|nr:methyltransferase domain-containing protein [Candidatus Omnitrophota bacterium]